MKKLLFITPAFPKDAAESHVIPFLQHVFLAFKAQYPDIDLTVVSIHKPNAGAYSWHGIEVIPFNGNDVQYPAKILFLMKSFYKIRKLNIKNQYDGIFNMWYNEFSVFTHFMSPKTKTWMLGQDVKKDNLCLKIFKPNPNKIVALSQFNNDVLYQTSGIKAHQIIPMAINESLFPELNLGERPIDVFAAGWFSKLKNYTLFVNVILELKKSKPNIKAEIAGSGDEERILKKFVKDNGLDDNITFLGLISHTETLDKMNHSKIFLHPSTFEGGSTVYFESLYSGCQLVGTLPMMDKAIENFHYHTSLNEIVRKTHFLLDHPTPPKRVIYYRMHAVCEAIYRLFYR